MEEVEQQFQNGLRLANEGKIEPAIEEFQKLVQTDPTGLPEDYYMQTYSEAYFNIGLLQSKKGNMEQGIENYKKAVQVFPEHKRTLYYMAYNLISTGEIGEAMRYYDKAKDLGFSKDYQQTEDFVGKMLLNFKKRELIIEYKSYFDHDKTIKIEIEGNPIGDNELIGDAISAIERVLKVSGYDIFSKASVEYIREREGKTIDIEKWTIHGDGWQKVIWVKYDSTPPEGFPMKIMITASEGEINE